eukprot:g2538.t1
MVRKGTTRLDPASMPAAGAEEGRLIVNVPVASHMTWIDHNLEERPRPVRRRPEEEEQVPEPEPKLKKAPKISYKRRSFALDHDDQKLAKFKRATKIRDQKRTILLNKLKMRILEKGSALAVFNEIDSDHSNDLSRKELNLYFHRLGLSIVAQDFDVFFREMDTDGNNVVDLKEFEAYVKWQPKLMLDHEKPDLRAQSLTMIHKHLSPSHHGTADRRLGWEQKRAQLAQETIKRKFVDSQFGNQLQRTAGLSLAAPSWGTQHIPQPMRQCIVGTSSTPTQMCTVAVTSKGGRSMFY